MFENYFWLLCGLFVGGVGGAFGKLKAKEMIANNLVTLREANSFLKGYIISIMVPCVLFWGLQVMAGHDAGPDFIRWSMPYKGFAVVLVVATWAALFVWVFFYGGSRKMERCLPLIGFFPEFMLKEKYIRIGVVLVIASGIWALTQKPV